ncbi:MAG: hypothetical protein IJV56_02930 [Neisseriaceae bacterium]|nr:hypothetical protein [Neisseriaceae bacterium]
MQNNLEQRLVLFERNYLQNINMQDNFATETMLQNYLIECSDNKEEVQNIIKQVLLILNYSYFEQNTDDTEIIKKLPVSFVSKFKAKLNENEQKEYEIKREKSRKHWLGRMLYDRNELKQYKKEIQKYGYINYDLENWLYWINQRTWFLGKFIDKTENQFIATFNVLDDFLANPFKLLFIHSGAKSVKPLDKNMNVLENDNFDVW